MKGATKRIPSGCKLGWTEGAVRKYVEVPPLALPIGCDHQTGHGSARSNAFGAAIRRVIAEFVESGGPDELVFCPELTIEERDIVCAEARKNHLQSRCFHRRPTDVYVVVSLHQSPMEIVNYLLKNGGESRKYRLLEPCKVAC